MALGDHHSRRQHLRPAIWLQAGPAIIREINLALGVGGAAVFPTLQLYVSDDNSGGGSNQANTFIPSGEPIFDLNVNQRDDGVGVADANGPTIFDLSEAAGYWRWPINRVTYKTRFFLKLRVNNTTATSAFGQGYVNVLENVAPGEVANFL